MRSLIQKNGKNHVRDVSETTQTIGERLKRMTNGEAKIKIRKILIAEIDKLPSHYDAEIGEQVFDNTAEFNELLELNKIVCGALERQTPKKPIDNTKQGWFECPNCGKIVVVYHVGKRPNCKCGQLLDWGGIE